MFLDSWKLRARPLESDVKPFEVEVCFEKTGGIALMGRGRALDGDYFVQADISAINLKIYDMADPSAPINGASGQDLTVSAVVFNSLQTSDPRWTKDSTGYNFLYVTTVGQLPAGGSEQLSDEQALGEALILGLRTSDGVPSHLLERRVAAAPALAGTLQAWQDRGLLSRQNGSARLTEAGFLLSDALFVELL